MIWTTAGVTRCVTLRMAVISGSDVVTLVVAPGDAPRGAGDALALATADGTEALELGLPLTTTAAGDPATGLAALWRPGGPVVGATVAAVPAGDCAPPPASPQPDATSSAAAVAATTADTDR